MKRLFITLFIFPAFCGVFAQSLTNVIGRPEGFASMNGGVTGGEGGPVVTVATADELRDAVDGSNTAVIILVKGTIAVVGEIPARGNKTIVGLGTDAKIIGGGFGWNTKSNVIVQNITFEDAPDDLLKINNKCTNFWIDHCTFSDGAGTNAGNHDGMLDVTRGSQYVTLSYNRFFNHDKNVLIGHSDSETGDVNIKVTLHHNWFDGTIQRNPRVRYATVHCYNNYHVGNSTYSIASACDANVLVENCYFKNCPIPLQVGVPGFSPAGYLVQRNCFFEGSGVPQLKDKDMTDLFPYSYRLDSVKYVPTLAQNHSGANKPSVPVSHQTAFAQRLDHRLQFNDDELIFKSQMTGPTEVSVYTSEGRLVDIPFRGWTEAGKENRLRLSSNSLRKGVYIVRLQVGSDAISSKIGIGL